MKKILIVLIYTLALSGCAAQNTNIMKGQECKRFIPMTKCGFRVAIIMAMTETAYAAYSLGLSELVIMQTLKDDFQFYYVNHSIGDTKNFSLDRGASCDEARNLAYSLENSFYSNFRELALSSMKEGQKKMINTTLSPKGAKQIIDKQPLDAIKDADFKCVKQNEAVKK